MNEIPDRIPWTAQCECRSVGAASGFEIFLGRYFFARASVCCFFSYQMVVGVMYWKARLSVLRNQVLVLFNQAAQEPRIKDQKLFGAQRFKVKVSLGVQTASTQVQVALQAWCRDCVGAAAKHYVTVSVPMDWFCPWRLALAAFLFPAELVHAVELVFRPNIGTLEEVAQECR